MQAKRASHTTRWLLRRIPVHSLCTANLLIRLLTELQKSVPDAVLEGCVLNTMNANNGSRHQSPSKNVSQAPNVQGTETCATILSNTEIIGIQEGFSIQCTAHTSKWTL